MGPRTGSRGRPAGATAVACLSLACATRVATAATAPAALAPSRYNDMLFDALASMHDDVVAQCAPVPRFIVAGRRRVVVDMHPISFSIPRGHVLDVPPPKGKPLAAVVPGTMETYEFRPQPGHTPAQLAALERDYFVDMQRSMFGLTWKKAGWDCLRHLELLASGCLPLFTDISAAPRGALALYPKKVLALLLQFPGVAKLEGVPGFPGARRDVVVDAGRVDTRLYSRAAAALLDYSRDRLASDAVAAQLLTVMGVPIERPRPWYAQESSARASRRAQGPRGCAHRLPPIYRPTQVLFLAMRKDTVDYMTDTLLHGFKRLLGDDNIIDHHRRSVLYSTPDLLLEKDWAPKRSAQYGFGFTYAHSMLFSPNATDADESALAARVVAGSFDVVVLTLVHRERPPMVNLVCKHYPRHRVAVVHGHDRPPTDAELLQYDACSAFQFVREAY